MSRFPNITAGTSQAATALLESAARDARKRRRPPLRHATRPGLLRSGAAGAARVDCHDDRSFADDFQFPLTSLQRHSGEDPHDMLHELLPGPHVTRVLGRIIEMHGKRYRQKYLQRVTAFSDVRTLFERVKRARRRIALATSASADELDHYLSLLYVGDLVDAVACGDDVQHDKPDSALIEVALLRAGKVAPEDAVMIGDTPYDAIAAKHARVRAIGMLSGGFSRTELEASGCAAVYRDPADFLAHYEETARLLA
ncbi:MAG: HAD family hydrolase [Alphaproteobacteria bacterium]|nr:MAG: HAD family hydrolase [Alphaproteobacteria bacterium]